MISHEALWTEFVAQRDPSLRERLILMYAPLVKYVINRTAVPIFRPMTIEDVTSYGIIGLTHAVDRYDPTKGVTFETYAIPRVRGAIMDGMRESGLFSRTDMAKVRELERTVDALLHELQRFPTTAELAERTNMPPREVERLMLVSRTTFVSLDAPVESEDGEDRGMLRDLLADDKSPNPVEIMEEKEVRAALVQSIQALPERSRLVISLYYVDELSPLEIAEVLGVSRSRVYQIHAHAIMELRALMRSKLGHHELLAGVRS